LGRRNQRAVARFFLVGAPNAPAKMNALYLMTIARCFSHGAEVSEAINQHNVQLLNNDDRHAASTSKYAWGTAHPCYNMTGSERVKWSSFEKDFVMKWCNDAVTVNPELEYKIVRLCLEHIKSDPVLIAEFHMHHTLDGSRLGYPWKEWKKKERLGGPMPKTLI
jgi:hypothetical protein